MRPLSLTVVKSLHTNLFRSFSWFRFILVGLLFSPVVLGMEHHGGYPSKVAGETTTPADQSFLKSDNIERTESTNTSKASETPDETETINGSSSSSSPVSLSISEPDPISVWGEIHKKTETEFSEWRTEWNEYQSRVKNGNNVKKNVQNVQEIREGAIEGDSGEPVIGNPNEAETISESREDVFYRCRDRLRSIVKDFKSAYDGWEQMYREGGFQEVTFWEKQLQTSGHKDDIENLEKQRDREKIYFQIQGEYDRLMRVLTNSLQGVKFEGVRGVGIRSVEFRNARFGGGRRSWLV